MSDKAPDAIAAPAAKAASAIAAGAGTSVLSLSQRAQSFLPQDLAGWLACAASAAALIYSLHLLAEWYWKRVLRPCFERRGWLAPKPMQRVMILDADQVVTE